MALRRVLSPNNLSLRPSLTTALETRSPSLSPSFDLAFQSVQEAAKPAKTSWRNIPFLKSFVPAITFSNVYSLELDLDPNFHKSVYCFASLLDDLTKHQIACHVPNIFYLMVTACDKYQDFLFVIDMSRNLRHLLTPNCYDVLLESLATSSLLDEMKQVYSEMLHVFSPGVHTLNIMIHAYCRLGYVVESNQYVCKMIHSGLTPDRSTFTSLIMGYSTTGGADAALRVFRKNMVQYGCTPDLKCYEQLIMGICIAKRLGTAQELFDQMQNEGITPSGMVFDELLGCCCKLHKYGEAADVVEDMLYRGYKANLSDCNTLICGLYEQGEKERARAVFDKLLQCQDYYHDEIAWKILIGGVLKKGLSDAFSQLFQTMQQSECHFTPQTLLRLNKGMTRCPLAIT